jgi:hypothetical protein
MMITCVCARSGIHVPFLGCAMYDVDFLFFDVCELARANKASELFNELDIARREELLNYRIRCRQHLSLLDTHRHPGAHAEKWAWREGSWSE